jgi:hypothetical protein
VILVKVGCKQCITLGSEEGSILGVDCWNMQHRK